VSSVNAAASRSGGIGVDSKFVMTTAQVLDEGVAGNNHLCRAMRP
jgi:hypothetical protein